MLLNPASCSKSGRMGGGRIKCNGREKNSMDLEKLRERFHHEKTGSSSGIATADTRGPILKLRVSLTVGSFLCHQLSGETSSSVSC